MKRNNSQIRYIFYRNSQVGGKKLKHKSRQECHLNNLLMQKINLHTRFLLNYQFQSCACDFISSN